MPKYGCWLDMPSLQVADIVAGTGFDFVVVDLEHGPASVETAQAQLMAIGARAEAIVRVPEASEAWIKRVLDAGADGVMVPKVESAEAARQIVDWTFYAPRGARGDARTVVRAAGWGRKAEEYKTRWNRDGFLAVQIESVAGLENIGAIAAVEGISELFFGPADYSADAGVGIDSRETLEAAKRIAEVANAHGLTCGAVTFPRGTPEVLAALGFSHIAVASDVANLAGALDTALQAARGQA